MIATLQGTTLHLKTAFSLPAFADLGAQPTVVFAMRDLNLIPAICRELGITPYELFGMKEPKVLYTPREECLVSNYRKLEEKYRNHVDTMMKSLVLAKILYGLFKSKRIAPTL